MNEFTLDELFTAYFDKEFDVPQQNIQPTCRHKRKMRKIFDAFSENQRKRNFSNIQKRFENGKAEHKHRLKPKQRIVITIAAVICAILFTGFVVKYISDSFSGTVYKDNTQLFAIRTDNCPEIIEDQYFLSAVPDGFEISESETTP